MFQFDSFFSHIDTDNIADLIVNKFDELLVLYNIIGEREDFKISTSDISVKNARFILKLNNESETNKLFNYMNNSIFSVFDFTYKINMEKENDTTIFITINLIDCNFRYIFDKNISEYSFNKIKS